jgi:phage terminase Nu1 subunit (DNA packaging protein)
MARTKSGGKVLNTADETEEISPPLAEIDEESAPPASKKEAAKLRLVSLKQAGALLDRDRNTIQKWLDQGCPYVTKADRSRGAAWELDLADVVRWLEKRAANSGSGKSGDRPSKEDADERRAIANAVITETDMLDRLHVIIPVSYVIDVLGKDYKELKDKLMTIPTALSGRVDASVAKQVFRIADEHIREVLSSLKACKWIKDYSKG